MEIIPVTENIRAITWDKENIEDIAMAKKKFEEFIRQGWYAYKVTRGNKKRIVLNFDPALEKIYLFLPALGG